MILDMSELTLDTEETPEAPVEAPAAAVETPAPTYSDDTGGAETNPNADNSMRDVNKTATLDMSALTLDEAPIAGGTTEPDPLVAPEPTYVEKQQAQGTTDYGTYHRDIAPAYQREREAYIKEFQEDGVTLDEAERYATAQVKKEFGVDEAWIAQAQVPKPLNAKEQNKFLEDYAQLYTSGQYGKQGLDAELRKRGHSQQAIDQMTLKTDQSNLGLQETVQLEMAKGDNGTLDNFAAALTGIGKYISTNYFSEDAGYSPVAKHMGHTILAENIASKMYASMPALLKMTGVEWDRGNDAIQWNANVQSINKDSVGTMFKAAAEGPSIGVESVAPVSWLTKAETAKNALIMSTKASGLGGVMAGGAIARDQYAEGEDAPGGVQLGEVNQAEVAAWTLGITLLPAAIAGGAALYKGGKAFTPGNQSRLAWRYVKKMSTPEQLAQMDGMVADMRKLGAFSDASIDEMKLIAMSKINPKLASEMAKEIATSPNAQKQHIRMQQAIKGATGAKANTSEQAARYFDELSDQSRGLAAGTNQALTQQLLTQGVPADSLVLPNNFEQLVKDLPMLPPKLNAQTQRLIKGDKNDAIDYQMVLDIKDSLFKYGTDTNDIRARGLSQQLEVTLDEIANAGIGKAAADTLIKEAKDAAMSSDLLEGLFNNNAFGRMFKDAFSKGAHNLDPILVNNLDIGARGKELDTFLNSLPTNRRGTAEELIVDAFAQGFEGSTEAARVFKIADYGGGGNGKELANSINVLRQTSFRSPKAQAKMEMLELLSRTSEFDGLINKHILNSPLGDIADEASLTQSLGFGAKFKLMIQPAMRFFAKRYVEGTAFRTKIRSILDESKYTSKLLGDEAVDFADANAMHGKLFSALYEAIEPSTFSKEVQGASGIKFGEKPPKELRQFMKEYKEFNEFRDTAVNTVFFKKVEGQPITGDSIGQMGDSVQNGQIQFTAGDVIPVDNKGNFALAVGANMKFKNLGLLNGETPINIRRILPYGENIELYKSFPGLQNLKVGGKKLDTKTYGGLKDNNVMVNMSQDTERLSQVVGNNSMKSYMATTLHEMGHFINGLSGLSKGSRPVYWATETPQSLKALAPQGKVTSASNKARAESEYVKEVGEQMGETSALTNKHTITGPDGVQHYTMDIRGSDGGELKSPIKDMPSQSRQVERVGVPEQVDNMEDYRYYNDEVYPKLKKQLDEAEPGSDEWDRLKNDTDNIAFMDYPSIAKANELPVQPIKELEINEEAVAKAEDAFKGLQESWYGSFEMNDAITKHVQEVYNFKHEPSISKATWEGDAEAEDIIKTYSSAFTDSADLDSFRNISKDQRAGKKTVLDTKLFDKHEPNYNGVSYNGSRLKGPQIEMFDNLKVGEIMGNKAFIATSVNTERPVESFMSSPWLNIKTEKPFMVTINGKGYDIGSSSSIKSEEEVLYAPNKNFKVVDKRTVGGVRMLVLEEVEESAVKGKSKNMDMLGITGVSTLAGGSAINKSKEQ